METAAAEAPLATSTGSPSVPVLQAPKKKQMLYRGRSQDTMQSMSSRSSGPSSARRTSVGSTHSHAMFHQFTEQGATQRGKLIRGATDSDSILLNLCRMKGSVFPKAGCIAIPCGMLAGLLAWLLERDLIPLKDEEAPLREVAAWSGFSFLVGFLIVFRTSQAYARFWEGCTAAQMMKAEWFDACSALVAFTKLSTAPFDQVVIFQNILVRLFSMLHAAALAAMEDSNGKAVEDVEAFTFELIDVESLDETSLWALRDSECKVELVLQWIQGLIVENIEIGVLSIPPPILSRAFQEIANGMVAFHEATKISSIPFPFPYAQTCDCLLVIHWMVSPLVVSQWVFKWYWACLFTFIQVFILWSLNCIAIEIENPFGMDDNDLDGRQAQVEMNHCLMSLLEPESWRVPQLSAQPVLYRVQEDEKAESGLASRPSRLTQNRNTRRTMRTKTLVRSFMDVWGDMDKSHDMEQRREFDEEGPARPCAVDFRSERSEIPFDSVNSEVPVRNGSERSRCDGEDSNQSLCSSELASGCVRPKSEEGVSQNDMSYIAYSSGTQRVGSEPRGDSLRQESPRPSLKPSPGLPGRSGGFGFRPRSDAPGESTVDPDHGRRLDSSGQSHTRARRREAL